MPPAPSGAATSYAPSRAPGASATGRIIGAAAPKTVVATRQSHRARHLYPVYKRSRRVPMVLRAKPAPASLASCLAAIALSLVTILARGSATTAMQPPEFDLLIRGGQV